MLDELLHPFPWATYSKKLQLRIETPYSVGSFSPADADQRNLFFASCEEGTLDSGNVISFYWLVDKTDGVIIDARFQIFGDSILIGLAECACELVIGKNYDQARRITAEIIERHLTDKGKDSAFSKECYGHLNLIVDALDTLSNQCQHIPLAQDYVAPPVVGGEIEVVDGGYPGWLELTNQQKLSVLDQVLTHEVRPYVEMDAGGVEVVSIDETHKVIIAYSGTCTSCHSATGATLSYIQQVLQAKVYPEITVTPQ